jgi:hypothetical protein
MQQSPNVVLHFGELAYGDRPFEVTDADNPLDVQLRNNQETFLKENIQKIVIQRFPSNWKYGLAIDADFHIHRHDWALETIHQLQHYSFVQPFSSYVDVSGAIYGSAQLPTRQNTGFFFNYVNNGYQISPVYYNAMIGKDGKPIKKTQVGTYEQTMLPFEEEGQFMRGTGATGGALAFRREAYDAVSGLMDRCILGHADWNMAFSLVGVEPPDIHLQKYHPDYKAYVKQWFEWAKAIKKNVGYTDAMATHYFHGSKTRRAYSSRDSILAKHQFSPYADLIADSQGIWQLNPNKPDLRDDVRRYMMSRTEDDPNIYPPEKIMV